MTKERIRFIIQILSFNKVPKVYLIHLVLQEIKGLNHLPLNGVVSDTINPTTIMTGNIINLQKTYRYKDWTVLSGT